MSYLYNRHSRRSFIAGVGGLIACPTLSSLLSSTAQAASSSNKRFIGISTPNQLPSILNYPSGYLGKVPPADLLPFISEKSDGLYPYREMSLAAVANIRGQFSALLDAKYNPYLNQMAVFRGLDMPGRIDHGRATTLGNISASHLGSERKYNPMKTMDEFLANSNNFYPFGKVAYPIPILRLGEVSISTSSLDSGNPNMGRGISGNNSGLTYNSNLKLIFDQAFANQTSSSSKAPIVDRIRLAVNSIKSQKKIGNRDSKILDEYMQNMFQLETRLSNAANLPNKPALSFYDLNGYNANLGEMQNGNLVTKRFYEDLAKLLVLSIQTGITKIATVGVDSSLLNSTSAVTQSGPIRDWHITIAHASDNAKILAAQKYITDTVFFEVMKGLSVPESGGSTYLDETLMYFGSECSYGHSGINFTGILAGNSAGGIKLGKSYEYADWTKGFDDAGGGQENAPGQPINRLWVGILHSLGLTPSDYINKFGNGTSGFGIWPEKYQDNWEQPFGAVSRGKKVSDSLAGLFSK